MTKKVIQKKKINALLMKRQKLAIEVLELMKQCIGAQAHYYSLLAVKTSMKKVQ